jgi:hypothetical protein
MALYGSDVLIAGKFAGRTSTQRNLVLVDGTTGRVIQWYNSPVIRSVLGVPQLGRVYGGGVSLSAFEVGGTKLWSRAPTTVDDSLRTHHLDPAYRDLDLAADGSTIWAACACDTVNGNPVKALVKLDTEGKHDTLSVADQSSIQAFGHSVVEANGALYLGAGGSDYLAQYSKADGKRTWVRDTSGSAQAVEVMDGKLVVGGHFWEVADNANDRCGFRSSNPTTLDPFGECQTRKGIAAYSFDGALEPNWDPVYAGRYNLVWALHVEGTRLHTGGEFLTVNGIKQTNHARLTSEQDITPPKISSVSPADGAREVASQVNAEATFSEAMNEASVTDPANFTLTKPDGTSVPATLAYDPTTKKATLDPNADLESGLTYTATIKGGTDGVKDVAGNPLAADEAWSFTTMAACTIVGTTSAETITGTSADDVICGGGGNDTIKALEGNDTLKGEGGADRLYGGMGDDRLDGGTGTDNANFSESLTAVSASLETNTATGEGSDTFSSIENLTGSNGNDTLRGSEANNNLNGLGGVDGIVGLGGADTLLGAASNDTLDSQDGVEGNDSVDGGGGTDICTTDATENSIVNCEPQ